MRAAQEVAAAGLGAALTDTLFNPLEVVKVRLQLHAASNAAPAESMLVAARAVCRRGGLSRLWLASLLPTWARSFCFTGLRVGLYPSLRDLLAGGADSTGVGLKVGAGASTGAIGSAITNPVDLVRTRLLAQAGRVDVLPSSLAVVRAALREGGVGVLWRGVGATALRATLLSGTQLATYDQMKQVGRGCGVDEGPLLHVAAGLLSGFVAQTVCQPADTIKTRVLSGACASNVWICLWETVSKEGVRALWQGYFPAVCRQCPVVLVQMPLIEAIRTAAGLGHM